MSLTRNAKNQLAIILFALSLFTTAEARIITVDNDTPADFNNIQAAIDDANDGDTVEIQPGTYSGPGNFDIRFNGKAITVRGTDPEDFDVVAATVIDCNNQGRAFNFENGEGRNSILSGLKITNGYAADFPGGGAVMCEETSPVISNCIITNNVGDYGGGISAYYADPLIYVNPVIKDCIITGNRALRNAGGIYVRSSSPIKIEDCFITKNIARDYGGGIYHSSRSVGLLMIYNCIISGNRSVEGNGGGICNRSDAHIAACTITNNYASSFGGGLCTFESLGSVRSKPESIISNSIIWNNMAESGAEIAVFCKSDYDYVTTSVSFSDVQRGSAAIYVGEAYCTLNWGPGNIDADPCLADPGYWGHIAAPDIRVEPNDPNASWVDGGDYHLKSQAGRWNASEERWTIDEVTSPCIDAGEPNRQVDLEPFPNGGRINVGVYGGSTEASKSYFGKPPCETIVAGDINGDCIIDYKDFALFGLNWLVFAPAVQGQATEPNPPDGATNVSISLPPLLSWTPCQTATAHNVYVGTESPPTFLRTVTDPMSSCPCRLPYTKYYWRIDDITPSGTITGAVWTFTTGSTR